MLEIIKTFQESGALTGLLQLLCLALVLFILPFVFKNLPALTANLVEWGKTQAKHVKNNYVSGILQRIIDLIGQKVLMVENSIIEDLKEKAKDGKLTKEELKAGLANAKQAVLDAVKADASAQGLWKLLLGIFLGDENALGKWLGEAVEATVAKLPPSGLQTSAVAGVRPVAANLPSAPTVP
jgi:hypothetical protein